MSSIAIFREYVIEVILNCCSLQGTLGSLGFATAAYALARGLRDANSFNAVISQKATTLLQIYAGYFLALFLVMQFCAACKVFQRNKVNYSFIFELDAHHNLDWRQLSEIPAMFMLLLGIVMNLNFYWVGGEAMYEYWPLALVSVTLLIICCPFPLYYIWTRFWFLQSFWRTYPSPS